MVLSVAAAGLTGLIYLIPILFILPDIPLLGLVLSTVVDCILGCIYFGSTSAFNAFTGVATICLSVSYGIPILVSLIRGRRAVRHSTFSLGKFGFFINAATVAWIMLAIVLFCMPTAIPVTAVSMNYASVMFSGNMMAKLLGVWEGW